MDSTEHYSLKETMDQYTYICEQLHRLEDQMEKLNLSINGNGKRGMKEDVLLNTEFRCRYQGMLDGMLAKMVAAFVAIGGLIIGAVYAIFQYQVK